MPQCSNGFFLGSKLLVDPSIIPVVVPYIIPKITSLKECSNGFILGGLPFLGSFRGFGCLGTQMPNSALHPQASIAGASMLLRFRVQGLGFMV